MTNKDFNIKVFVRYGKGDVLCNSRKEAQEMFCQFLGTTEWQMSFHRVYGTCGLYKGFCKTSKQICLRATGEKFCKESRYCQSKKNFYNGLKVLKGGII
jgi:hypothetical protein